MKQVYLLHDYSSYVPNIDGWLECLLCWNCWAELVYVLGYNLLQLLMKLESEPIFSKDWQWLFIRKFKSEAKAKKNAYVSNTEL